MVQSGVKWLINPKRQVKKLFYGEHPHTIDPKGRVIIPSKFREGLGEKFILTKGLDGCLFAFPESEWTSIEQKLKSLPFADRDVRNFVRFFFSGATECETDKQGRVLVSPQLREYAKLKKDVFIVGISSRVEIWDRDKWTSISESEDIGTDKIADMMFKLGI